MLCLLTRELPLRAVVRLWDCYMCDARGVAFLHPCICAVLLHTWSHKLFQNHSFEESLMFLQQLPTGNWGPREMDHLIPEALELQRRYQELHQITHAVLTEITIELVRLAMFATKGSNNPNNNK
jgi:hypothetical protein